MAGPRNNGSWGILKGCGHICIISCPENGAFWDSVSLNAPIASIEVSDSCAVLRTPRCESFVAPFLESC